MDREKKLSEKTQKTLEKIRQSGISEDSLARYKRIFQKLQQFYESRGESEYKPAINREYIEIIKSRYEAGDFAVSEYQRHRRAIATLEGYVETSQIKIRYSYGTRYHYQLSQHYETHLKNFVSSLDVASGSTACFATTTREIFSFMESQGIKEASQITQEDIKKYIMENARNHAKRMSIFLMVLRKLVAYLKNIVGADVTEQVVALKGRRGNRRVFPAFTEDELNAVLKQPDLETKTGKRDYAIMLLASYTGFRSVDIANLKLKDINWLEKTVSIVQRKTGVPNCLPLDQAVLAAIADYILNGRPEIQSNYVFITVVPPYRNLCARSSVRNILTKCMEQANITHTPLDGKGFHAIRRRMGVRLLKASMPSEMIMQILGQTEIDSVKYYLPMDTEQLRICALGFDGIPITGGVYL